VPVELQVLLSHHTTDRHFKLLAQAIDEADVVCPESVGLFRENLPQFYRLFRGTEDERKRNIARQYNMRLPDAAYNAALITHLFNRPNVVLLDFAETREQAEEITRLHYGVGGRAVSELMVGAFDEALSLGFDTVESRARAFDLRNRQVVRNVWQELPAVVNGIKPKRGGRVLCAILFGTEHLELPGALDASFSGVGDVSVSFRRVEESASLGFDRLVHDVLSGDLRPLDRGEARNRELMARGLLDVLTLNFYPPNSPIRQDGSAGSRIITRISDRFSLEDIQRICREAGVEVKALKGDPDITPSLIWSEKLKAFGAVFPPTYPRSPLRSYL
jgi:hypothetical protein